MCGVYGENCLSERQCPRLFAVFRSGGFNLYDARRSGRPIAADDDKIKEMIDLKPALHISMQHKIL